MLLAPGPRTPIESGALAREAVEHSERAVGPLDGFYSAGIIMTTGALAGYWKTVVTQVSSDVSTARWQPSDVLGLGL